MAGYVPVNISQSADGHIGGVSWMKRDLTI